MSKVRDFLVRLALIVSLLVPVYFLVAALGTKFGLFDWRVGFGLMTFQLGAFVLMGAAGVSLIALLMALFTSPRRGIVQALAALLIPALGLGYAGYVRQQAQSIPPIHDISTDLVDPPVFSAAVIEARSAVPGVNDLDLLNKRTGDGRAFIELQQAAYADIQPVISAEPAAVAWDVALQLAQEQGWVIGHTDIEVGVIEASASTFWYGFTDDIVVRVRPDGEGARIDVRSVSRVGRSDLGANAARLRPFLAELERRTGGASG